jgi:hypothetical protein
MHSALAYRRSWAVSMRQAINATSTMHRMAMDMANGDVPVLNQQAMSGPESICMST